MKRTLSIKSIANLLALATSMTLAATVGATEPVAPPSIAVTGQGEHSAPPTLAVIGFAVETAAPTAAQAMDENARKSQAVSDAIKGAIGGKDRLSTAGFGLDPVYDHRQERANNQPPAITGYIARNEVRVETVNTKDVGRLIDLATKAGANRVSGLQFTIEDQREARDRALEKAAEDAKRQANTIASSLGVRVGKVLAASTASAGQPPPMPFFRAAMAMEAQATTPIEPGDVRVEATLHVTYAID